MKRIKIYRLVLYFIFLFICFFVYDRLFVYHVTLKGKPIETVNINSKYVDPGINVKLAGKAYNNVKKEDNINTSVPGIYKVVYHFGKMSRERIVEVKDIEKPVITLKGDNINLNYKEQYKEPGYSAYDNYDGDVSDKVIIINNVKTDELGEYDVSYFVQDSTGNEATVNRHVIVSDIEKPEISFSTNNFLILGKKFNINDYKAIDNYDGDITNKVVVNGTVNNKKEGNYLIKYSVKDSSGNEQNVNRTINVQKKNTKGIPVLMYHWFYDDTKGEKPGIANSHNYISKTELEKQLKYIKSNNYYFPTWKELESYIDGKIDLPRKSIIFTDDDCKDSFFEVALPLFQKYEIPVTSYCITRKHNYQKYMKEKYLDFESHTNSMHRVKCNTGWFGALMCSSYKEIYDDINLSIKKLGNRESFAYPYGHYNDTAIKALKDNGIRLAFTINEGRVKRGANKYKLPRVRISSWTSIDKYKSLVE